MNAVTQSSSASERVFQRWFVIFLIIMNGVAFAIAAEDKSWLALGILIAYGPIMNGVFALIGGIAAIVLRKRNRTMSLRRHFSIVVGSSLLAGITLCAAISLLDLHGC